MNLTYGVPDAEAIPGLLRRVVQNQIGYFDITDREPEEALEILLAVQYISHLSGFLYGERAKAIWP